MNTDGERDPDDYPFPRWVSALYQCLSVSMSGSPSLPSPGLDSRLTGLAVRIGLETGLRRSGDS